MNGKSIESVLSTVSEYFLADFNKDDWYFTTINGEPEFCTDIQVTVNQEIPTQDEYERWKKGKLDLYVAHVHVFVSKVTMVIDTDSMESEAEKLGIEIE